MGDGNTAQEWVEKLKMLLGIEKEEKEPFVAFALDNAEETVKNYCRIEEIPPGLYTTVFRIAADIYRNEQLGSVNTPQNVKSISAGDTSTTFSSFGTEFSESIMKNYKSVLNRYRRIEF